MLDYTLDKRLINKALCLCIFAWVFASPAIGEESIDLKKGGLFSNQSEGTNLSDQKVTVGSFGEVDLHVKELEVSKVLQLLSIQSERNIIASRNVAGTISADLYGVDFYEALDAILHTNGFGYQEKGNLIFVYTTSELQAIRKSQRKLSHRIIRLNYITAADAAAFVTPLLSGEGSISISTDTSPGFVPSLADGGANSFANTDTLIIHDYAEVIDEIASIIEELDKRPKQVLVEATILQARLTESNAFGVDLSVLANFAVSTFTNPLGIIDDLANGLQTPTSPVGGIETTVGNTGTGLSSAKIGIVTHNVAAFIKALDAVTDTTVMANPKLLVLNRQKADLLVGEKLGYISTTSTDTSTTQTVEFLEIGTQLTLRPFVSDDGFIRMELKPSISDGGTRETAAGAVIPETTNQELTTNVVVRNGQTVVLGGLFKEDTIVTHRQVPGLGDIPILGVLFKGHEDTVGRNEVIFLITPTIIKDESLYAISEQAQNQVNIARLGAREGLLPWSRTKMTTAHIRDAQKYYDTGQREKALWSANMALTLDPRAADAIRLKEQLTGRSAYKPANFSILKDAIDGIIRKKVGGPGGRTHLPEDDSMPAMPGNGAGSRLEPVQKDHTVSGLDPESSDGFTDFSQQDNGSGFSEGADPWRDTRGMPPTDIREAIAPEVDSSPPAIEQYEEPAEITPEEDSSSGKSWLDNFIQTPLTSNKDELEIEKDPSFDQYSETNWQAEQAEAFDFVEDDDGPSSITPAVDPIPETDWQEPAIPEVEFDDDVNIDSASDSFSETQWQDDDVAEINFENDTDTMDALVPSSAINDAEFKDDVLLDEVEGVPSTDAFNAVVEWLLPENGDYQYKGRN